MASGTLTATHAFTYSGPLLGEIFYPGGLNSGRVVRGAEDESEDPLHRTLEVHARKRPEMPDLTARVFAIQFQDGCQTS